MLLVPTVNCFEFREFVREKKNHRKWKPMWVHSSFIIHCPNWDSIRYSNDQSLENRVLCSPFKFNKKSVSYLLLRFHRHNRVSTQRQLLSASCNCTLLKRKKPRGNINIISLTSHQTARACVLCVCVVYCIGAPTDRNDMLHNAHIVCFWSLYRETQRERESKHF